MVGFITDNLNMSEYSHTAPNQDPQQEAVAALASAFHENWRNTRKQEGSSFAPRIKTTNDEASIAAHSSAQIDIANTAYADLPEDWQAENKAAAGVIVDILNEASGSVDLTNEEQRQYVGGKIHDAWFERNAWARGGELDVPFAQQVFQQ
jgi:hypothetical protein